MDPLPSVEDAPEPAPGVPAVDRAEYHALELGAGRSVVLLHDLFATHESFAAVMDSLAEEWRTVGVDLPGHGRSTPPGEGAGLDTVARELHQVLVEFGALPAVVVGEGAGATIALELALAHGDGVAALVLVSPTLGTESAMLRKPAVSAWLAGSGDVGDFVDTVLPGHHGTEFFRDQPGRAASERTRLAALEPGDVSPLVEAVLAGGDRLGAVAGIGVPVLVVLGGADTDRGKERARAVAAAAGATCVEVGGAGHLVSLDHPDRLAAALREFLNGL